MLEPCAGAQETLKLPERAPLPEPLGQQGRGS